MVKFSKSFYESIEDLTPALAALKNALKAAGFAHLAVDITREDLFESIYEDEEQPEQVIKQASIQIFADSPTSHDLISVSALIGTELGIPGLIYEIHVFTTADGFRDHVEREMMEYSESISLADKFVKRLNGEDDFNDDFDDLDDYDDFDEFEDYDDEGSMFIQGSVFYFGPIFPMNVMVQQVVALCNVRY